MPPWWLIGVWITLTPLSIRLLIKPTAGWKRFKREYAEDNPTDPTVNGWYAQTELQAWIGLATVGISTLVWLTT
jgi:hypothetical protein